VHKGLKTASDFACVFLPTNQVAFFSVHVKKFVWWKTGLMNQLLSESNFSPFLLYTAENFLHEGRVDLFWNNLMTC
jgi:hypothetical protein